MNEKWKNILQVILLVTPSIFFVMAILALYGDGIIELLTAVGTWLFIIFAVVCIILGFVLKEYRWKHIIALIALSVIELIVLISFTKPWYQSIAMGIYMNPMVFEVLGISSLLTLVVICVLKARKSKKVALFSFIAFCITFFVIVLAFGIVTSNYYNCHLARNLDITEIISLPEMEENFLRITPMKVGDKWATDACQYPRHTPAMPSDIAMINGIPHWSYLLVPGDIVNVFNIKPVGAIFIDMTTIDKNTNIKEQSVEIAPKLQLEDSIYWKIFQDEKYWIDCERVLVFLYEEEIYQAIPYIEYDLHFEFPIWYQVPKWGGVFLIDNEGNIEDLSPEEARENPVLNGQKMFPEKLVLTYINSQNFWKARNGSFMDAISNIWWDHIDEIEITDVGRQGNQQPFLMNTKDGLKWIVSVEPCGKSHGIFRIYLLDARTGKIEWVRFSGEEIGPVKACDYVRQAHPEVKWDLFQAIEPIPVTPNGVLYWETRVVPDDGSGISYTAFVNPKTGKVVECRTDEDIDDFMKGIEIIDDEKYFVSGEIFDIDVYIQNGNTRWVFDINHTDILARAEDLNFTTIKCLIDLEIGDYVTIEIIQPNILREIE